MAASQLLDSDRPWCPPVDVHRMDHEYVVVADLPGLDLNSIHVKKRGTTLSISGDRLFDPEENVEEHLRLERLHGKFICEVNLPGVPEISVPSTEYQEGVLTVRVPRT